MRYLALIGLVGAVSLLQAQPWETKEEQGQQRERAKWFYDQRSYPGTQIPAGARIDAIHRMDAIDAASRLQHRAAIRASRPNAALGAALDSANWTLIGPKPTGAGSSYLTTGRVNAIAVDPRSNNTVYIGAAEGGVWKTSDGGVTWNPLTDAQVSLANGSIAIDAANPDTVYVGTGEDNFSGDSYYGAGILKSTDGGNTWTNLPGPFASLRTSISRIAIQPGNSNVLLCSSAAGLYRSPDGGQTWLPALAGYAYSATFDPSNPNSAYVTLGYPYGTSVNGVYHSTDGGVTWKAVRGTGSTAMPAGASMGRIELAMAPSNSSILYAQVQDPNAATFGQLLGIWKSTDGGSSWVELSIPASVAIYWGVSNYYASAIAVHPSNPDVVWAGGLGLIRSMDGGVTWQVPSQVAPNTQEIHVDQHLLVYTNDGSELYIANDGGIYSTSGVTAPVTQINWNTLGASLAITQFYPGIAIDPANSNLALGGTQDNGTQLYSGGLNWQTVTCGDGGYNVMDSAIPGDFHTSCPFISVERNVGGAGVYTFAPDIYGIDATDPSGFIVPLQSDPANPRTLYLGTYRIWQELNNAGRWAPVSPDLTNGKRGYVSAIAVAPSDSNTVYAGTSNARVFSTNDMNDGASAVWNNRTNGLPTRSITQLAVDPSDPQTAYLTFSGFNGGIDVLGHVFKTSTGGTSWFDISGNLPNIPVNDIVLDPDVAQTLYIATDIGVMVTTDGGNTWSTLGSGLPRVAVVALALQRNSRILRAGTHGRSMWDILVPLGGASAQPTITSLSPSNANVGGGDFTLTVAGSNFTSNTVVRWNGASRQTAFVDAGHVTAAIQAADLASLGQATVAAFNPGVGNSNLSLFSIGAAPQSAPGAAVSAANPLGGPNLAVRSIASIYGANFSSATGIADLAPPLPFSLAGATLTLLAGRQAVPLFFVSPNQINFQVPLIGLGVEQLVITQGSQSVTVPINLVNYAPALFSTNSQGSGQGSVTIANSSTLVAPAGAFAGSRPAQAGEYISIYCTGLGPTLNQPVLGSPSPSSPLATTTAQPTVTIGGVPASIIFAGLAPGYVGLYQVNAQVPQGVSAGSAVPVVLTIGGVQSNTVTIAVN